MQHEVSHRWIEEVFKDLQNRKIRKMKESTVISSNIITKLMLYVLKVWANIYSRNPPFFPESVQMWKCVFKKQLNHNKRYEFSLRKLSLITLYLSVCLFSKISEIIWEIMLKICPSVSLWLLGSVAGKQISEKYIRQGPLRKIVDRGPTDVTIFMIQFERNTKNHNNEQSGSLAFQ